MKDLPQGSEDFRRKNPHLYKHVGDGIYCWPSDGAVYIDIDAMKATTKRIRQSTKPLLNKLEQEWFDRAKRGDFSQSIIIPQSVKFKLANGVWFLPDFFVIIGGFDSQDITPRAIEIKGPQQLQDDAVVKLKVAAKAYPWIRWSIEWKTNGKWDGQHIYP